MTTAEAKSLTNWKAAAKALAGIGRQDLAKELLENPADRQRVIGNAGGVYHNRCGFAKAVRFCELLNELTSEPLPALD